MRPALPRATWLAGLALALLGLWHAVVAPVGPLARLDLTIDDLQQRSLPSAGPHPDVLIVDIDEASLQAIGRWPWPRSQLARLSTELLQRQQVAVLGLDLVFPEPSADDTLLAAAWQGQPVVTGFYFTADRAGHRSGSLPTPLARLPPGTQLAGLPVWTGYATNVPALALAAPQAGFFNVVPDADGLVRSLPAVAVFDGQLQPSLALAMLHQASGRPQISPVLQALAGEPPRQVLDSLRLQPADDPKQAARSLPLDERGALRLPFSGPGGPHGGSFQYIHAADLILGKLPAASLRGKLVLVGSSAPGLGDLRPTPVHSAMPGVEIHATLLAGLLAGPLPYRPAWAPGYEACLILLSLLLSGWAASRASVPMALTGSLAVAASLIASNLLLRHAAGLILPVGSALLLSLLLAAALAARGHLREWHERRSLLGLFDQYLPPERVRELARDPDFANHPAANRELTVMFCDLQGFSSLAEHLPPLALRDLLNQYFSTATRIVHAHQGTLDKFIGDAVMAFWGAPQAQADHASRAVRAALALADAAAPLNAELAARGLPAIRFGIGLASGVVCVGDLGSALRRSYTAVGDAVNVAARLEALTRELGMGLLVAESTRALCAANLPDIAWAEVAESPIRGREQTVTIVTPVRLSEGCKALQSAQVHSWTLAQAAARGDDLALARAHLARLHALPQSSSPSALAPSDITPLPADLAALVHGLEQRLTGPVPATGAPAP